MGVKKSWMSKYKEIPCIFSHTKTREFLLLFQNSFEKKTCEIFWQKKKIDFFFDFFSKRCSFYSSEGTKSNQKKLSSCFRESCEFMFKKSKKKPTPHFREIFWKKENSNFFPRIFQKMCRNIYLRELKQLRKSMK